MKKTNSKLFWYLSGMATLVWIVPLISNFVNLITYYIQIVINDINRENQKSQSIVNAEFPIYSYKEDYDDE